MTEETWLACTDSLKMFRHFGGAFGKMRLNARLRRFAVESCRRIRHLLTDDVFLRAVDAGEAFADDRRNDNSTIPAMARAAIEGWRRLRTYPHGSTHHQFHAARAAIATCGSTDWHAAYHSMREAAQALKAEGNSYGPFERKYQADLLRCIFGPPLFRPIAIASSWLTPTVTNLVQAIYDDRQLPSGVLGNQRLGVLAGALEEAGCDNADILGHLRGGGTHVRGCWVIDLVLGKM